MAGGATSGGGCLSDSTIAGFLERSLSSERRAELEAHIDGCASCRQILVALSAALPLSSISAALHTTHPARLACTGNTLVQGTIVGRFVVLGLLGAGGMGIVYTAYDPELARSVALKLLGPVAQGVSDARAHLLAEAQAMAQISHAHVITVYDVGTYRDQVFVAMELVEGVTLRTWMADPSRTWVDTVNVFLLAGEGLAAAHAAGVIHRDFKPENVLLGSDGRVKVSDFGLATVPSTTGSHVGGTPGYVPMEALRAGSVDARGDQFSFCVALHEALHGSRPFSARAFDELVAEVRRGPARVASGRRVPARLDDVVRRGLALAPGDRYPSMRELLAEIRRVVAARPRHRRAIAALAVVAFAAGATALVMDVRGATRPAPCTDAAAQLAGVWDLTRRAAVQSAFVRAATPSEPAVFAAAAAMLDRYAAEWTELRTDVCEATEVRRVQPAAMQDLRMACLDRARIQLRALVTELAKADRDAVMQAVAAVASLPALDACSDSDALRAIISPPLGAIARTQIQAAAGDADRAGASGETSKVDIGDHTGRPDFRLPFGCGERWQLSSRSRHQRAGRGVDFYLPGDEASAGLAVFASAPGWVSNVIPDNGEVDINHGGGWFTTYQHMSDIAVTPHQYVGRGHVIGKVANVNVANSLGGRGAAHLHHEQAYQPGATRVTFDRERGPGDVVTYLQGEALNPSITGPLLRTSSNNCKAGGAPGGAVQYDVPAANAELSRSRPTIEIMTRRSDDHALFEHWYDLGWNGAPLSHTIVGRPAVAVFKGTLHVIARKSNGTIFDLHYHPFTGWKTTYLDGNVSGDPDVGVYGWNDRLYVVARGSDGFLYRWWMEHETWAQPVQVGRIAVVGTPALFSHYDTLYIVARTSDGAMWAWETDRQRSWTEWQLAGAAVDNPTIGVDPRSGLVNIFARGVDNRLYRWPARDPGRSLQHAGVGWSEREVVDADRLVTGAPATIVYHGAMHIIARAPDNAIYHWWRDSAWHWEAIPGAYSGDPEVFQFGAQLQTTGRGTDGNLHTVWYDDLAGVWTQENHDIPISD